jgi:zinc finger SWIM domain-containing protein 3
MANAFKKQNSKWRDVRIIMADKDLNERESIKQAFHKQQCSFVYFIYTLRTFKQEITSVKLGITSSQRTLALDILQKICYAN